MEKIDCRGLDCPGPVLKTKAQVEKRRPEQIDIMVDNDAAVENVSRFLDFQGYRVSVESDGRVSVVTGIIDSARRPSVAASGRPADSGSLKTGPAVQGPQKILIMIGSTEIGRGDRELGEKLMVNYLKTLKEMGSELWHLIFVNHGVRFAVKGSRVLADLDALEKEGTRILVCGTCLDHLGLLDEKMIGQTTNMLDIVTAMQLADKIINL